VGGVQGQGGLVINCDTFCNGEKSFVICVAFARIKHGMFEKCPRIFKSGQCIMVVAHMMEQAPGAASNAA
jgi:hypothetical protein